MATLLSVVLWAQAPVGTTLFSENFGGYSANDVPSGSVSALEGSRVIYGGGSVTYTCVNGGSNTKIYNENTGGGTAPEILIGKKNDSGSGSLTIAGIPSGGAQAITVSFTQNKQALSVTPTGTGYSGSISGKPAAVGTRTFDITVADGADATFTLTFAATGSSNVRVDDILVTVKTAGESSGGGEDPETQTVYLNGGGSSLWNQAGAEFFAHTWGGAEAVAVKMTLVEGDVYSAAIPADNNNVVFVRMQPESSAIDWDNCWNKTEDLTIEGGNNLYTITAWGEGGNKVCSGVWSVYDDGGDTPEPPVAEKDSIFFVNASDWIALRVHLWGGSAAGTEWPGVEMTPVAEKINSYEVFKLIVDKGAYANCIFNNNGKGAQTGDLDWTSGQYFYKDAWYAKEAIPAETPVTTFVGFDAGNTLGAQLAAGLAKNRVNVTFVEGEGDNQNKYSVNLVQGGVEGSFSLGGVVFAYTNSNAGATAWKTYGTYIQPNGKDREVRIPLEAGKQAKVVLSEACAGVLVNGESTDLVAGENILTATADGLVLKSASTKPKIQAILPVDAPEPPVAEKDSIFFVNASDWEAVRVHLWGGSAAGTEWPGVVMTKEAEQINGHDVYKLIDLVQNRYGYPFLHHIHQYSQKE